MYNISLPNPILTIIQLKLDAGNTDFAHNLSETYITEVGVRLLLNQQLLKLKELYLVNGKIANQGTSFILAQNFPALQTLTLHNCGINGSSGLDFLPKAEFHMLKQLWLNRNKIGPRGAKMITKAQSPLLKKLSLYDCQIGIEGLKHITKGNWPLLTQISLSNMESRSYDCFSSIVDNNWSLLKYFHINEGSVEQKHAPIAFLCCFPANWPGQLDILFCNPVFATQELDKIIKSRFPETKVFEEDTE